MTLKELEIGDIFYPKSQHMKRTPYFKVIGEPEFNARHGSATRICKNLVTGESVSKSCRLEIMKRDTKPNRAI